MSRLIALISCCVSLTFLLTASPLEAQCEQQKLVAPDAANDDMFGVSVNIQGDIAVVGAQWDDDLGGNSGSAYVYRRSGVVWNMEQKLGASDGQPSDYFGTSVALDGDVIVVGANLRDGPKNSGAAYVFRFDGIAWIEEDILTASDAGANDDFGFEVAIDGDVIVVGANMDDDFGTNSGSAYVYRYDGTNWNEQAKLLPADGAARDQYGIVVSVSGDVVAVSSELDDDQGSGSGSVYMYRFDGTSWAFEQKLVAFDGAANDGFGAFVAVDGDVLLSGAWLDDDKGTDSGSAYVYRFDGTNWAFEQKLIDSGGRAGDGFGGYVALDGNTIVIGESMRDVGGSNHGAALIFRHNGNQWIQKARLLASDRDPADNFGYSVAVDGDSILIGSLRDDLTGSNEGSAYVFLYGDATAGWSNYGSGWPGTVGVPALTASAAPEIGGSFHVLAGNSSGQAATALLFVGTQATSLVTGLGGTLLVVPYLVLPLTLPGGGVSLPADLPCDGILDGLHIYVQSLQVDAGASQGVSFSAGLDLLLGY